MSDEKKMRLERLRAGYRRWRDAMDIESNAENLTSEQRRKFAEILAFLDCEPKAAFSQRRKRK